MSAPSFDLVVRNGRIVTCDGPEAGSAWERLGVIDRGLVAIRDGRVVHVGPDEAPADASPLDALRTVDAEGCAVLPGLVDCHTHLVFAGSRVDELARRMAGEDYRAIAAAGGGIAATVRATRGASDGALLRLASGRALAMRAHGTTSLEVKSGYGLTLLDELRSLRVGRRLHADGYCRTTTTFLGAHTVPPERRSDRAGYVRELVEEMLPAVAAESLADACDVYLDEGAFTLEEARRVLETAKALGLAVRGHVGQFEERGGAELLAELGALSADHLERTSEAGARALGAAGVVGVLLPGAWRTLRQTPPDAGLLRACGVRLAVATDCNPGTSPTTDLPLCAALAVRDAGLSLEEALLGVTAEAARAAGIEGAGRLRVGSFGDLSIYPQEDPRALAYGIGDVRPRVVFMAGERVHEAAPGTLAVW